MQDRTPLVCAWCGTEFSYQPNKKYCSPRCRQQAFLAGLQIDRTRVTCENCGSTAPYERTRRFCSRRCQRAAYVPKHLEVSRKLCRGCDREKAVEDFYRDTSKPGGLASRCKDCVTAYARRNRQCNAGRLSEQRRAGHHRNKAANNLRSRAYYRANRERLLAQLRESYDPDVARAKNRLNYIKHRAWYREYQREYWKSPAGKQTAARSRFRKKAIRASLPNEDYSVAGILTRDGDTCHLCEEVIDFTAPAGRQPWHIDHLIPLSAPWPQHPGNTLVNVALTHARCNSGKYNKILPVSVAAYYRNLGGTMPVTVKLVDKDGTEWLAGSAEEVVNLLAQGYRFKGQGTAGVADQAAPAGPKPTNPPSNVANPAPVSNTGAVSPAGDGSGK